MQGCTNVNYIQSDDVQKRMLQLETKKLIVLLMRYVRDVLCFSQCINRCIRSLDVPSGVFMEAKHAVMQTFTLVYSFDARLRHFLTSLYWIKFVVSTRKAVFGNHFYTL